MTAAHCPALPQTDWLSAAAWKAGLKHGAHQVLCALARYARRAGDETGLCWPAQETLAKDTGLSTRTISRAVKTLSAQGFLSIESLGNGRDTTRYRLAAPSSWGRETEDKGPVFSGPWVDKMSPLPRQNVTQTLEQNPPLRGFCSDQRARDCAPEGAPRGAARPSQTEEPNNTPALALEAFAKAAQAHGWAKAPTKMNRYLEAKLRAVLNAHGLEGWIAAIGRAAASPFVNRKIKPRIGFFIARISAILEGRYDPFETRAKSAPPEAPESPPEGQKAVPPPAPSQTLKPSPEAAEPRILKPWDCMALPAFQGRFEEAAAEDQRLEEWRREGEERGESPLSAKAFALWRKKQEDDAQKADEEAAAKQNCLEREPEPALSPLPASPPWAGFVSAALFKEFPAAAAADSRLETWRREALASGKLGLPAMAYALWRRDQEGAF